MTNSTLVVIPGPGARSIELNDNSTVSDLVCQENLHGRDIIINGQGVIPANWETTLVPANAEIFATGSVKGNNSQITLVVIPGPGARSIELNPEMTIADLACQENLHGRDIIVNGQGVPVNSWNTTFVIPNSEIFATGSVKGN
jgi:sulfur carrier protein ThiS